jgi:hypothetical protein
MDTLAPNITAAEVLAELQRWGHRVSVITRVDVHAHSKGPQPITYADKLWITTPQPLTDELRDAIHAHRDELLAAACVIAPPVPWLATLVGRYWDGRANLAMLANNVAAFMGLHPGEDGPRFAQIISEVLN